MKTPSLVLSVLFTVSLFGSTLLTGCSTPKPSAGTQPVAAADRHEIAALFDRWNASLATLNPDRVVANYTTNAVLLPTVSNQPRTNPAELRDYFVAFLKKRPQGKINQRTIRVEGKTAWDVGIYTFTLHGPDGKASEARARYSFIYERQPEGGWLIAHHHSSLMPEVKAPME